MLRSTHAENVMTHLYTSKMTSEILSSLSCNEDKFIKASGEYQNVLKNSGFSITEVNVTEKSIGATPKLISRLKKILAKLFFNFWTEIFHPILDCIRLSTETL